MRARMLRYLSESNQCHAINDNSLKGPYMKIRAIFVIGTLGALCQPASAFVDECAYLPPSMNLIHYVTLTSAEASDPNVEAYALFTDAYNIYGSWLAGAHRVYPDNNGAGMQSPFHMLTWTQAGDMINSQGSHLLTDYDGEWYWSEFGEQWEYELHILDYGNECWAVEPY